MNKIVVPILFVFMLLLANAGVSLAIARPSDNGWVRKAFDFGSEDINFETIVPPEAKVETTELGSPDHGTIGKVKIVGKIHPVSGYSPVEVTIKAFDLLAPASASRVCGYEIESAGFTPRSLNSAPDLSDTRIFATKSNGSRPMEQAFSRCLTRGNKMLALHFMFEVSSAKDVEASDVLVAKAQDYANAILSNITFTDGKPVGYGDGMKDVPVTIGTEELTLSVPALWSVAINDFRSPPTASRRLRIFEVPLDDLAIEHGDCQPALRGGLQTGSLGRFDGIADLHISLPFPSEILVDDQRTQAEKDRINTAD